MLFTLFLHLCLMCDQSYSIVWGNFFSVVCWKAFSHKAVVTTSKYFIHRVLQSTEKDFSFGYCQVIESYKPPKLIKVTWFTIQTLLLAVITVNLKLD